LGRGEQLCRHSIDFCFFFPGFSDIPSFVPLSPIEAGHPLDRAEEIPNIAQTTGTVDYFDPRSGIT
jgi:hypothetical protein